MKLESDRLHEVAADTKILDILEGKLKFMVFDLKAMYPVKSSNGFEGKKVEIG